MSKSVEHEYGVSGFGWVRSLVDHAADRRIALSLFLIGVVLGSARLAHGVTGVYHDDGIYVATAKSLAEGRGYRLIDLPGEPPQTKYPILYPLGLAALWRAWPAFPENLVLLQGCSIVSTALALALGYLYLVRVAAFSRSVSGIAALICVTSPVILYFSTQVLSEPLFAVATVVMLFAADNTIRQPARSRSGDVLRGFLIAAPFLVRLVGAASVCPIALLLLLKPRRHGWVLAGIAATAASWIIWVLVELDTSALQGAATYYTAQPYSSWWFHDPVDLREVVRLNVFGAWRVTAAIPMQIFAGSRLLLPSILMGAATWVMVARGMRDRRMLTLSLLAYLALIVFWPWPPARFIVPIALFPTACLVEAVGKGTTRLPARARLAVVAMLVALVVGSNLRSLAADIAVTRQTGYPQPSGYLPVFWKDYEETFSWIRVNSRDEDVLASGLDTMLFLYTGRKGIRPFEPNPLPLIYRPAPEPLGTVDSFTATLLRQSARFVVRLPMPGFAEESHLNRLIDRVRVERPGCLQERYTNPRDARFVVYEIGTAACRPPSASSED